MEDSTSCCFLFLFEQICTHWNTYALYMENYIFILKMAREQVMTFIFLLIAIIILILQRIFTNVYVLIYLGLGIIWFIAESRIKAKIKDPDSTAFALIRIITSLAYFLGLFVVILAVNATAEPIRFM